MEQLKSISPRGIVDFNIMKEEELPKFGIKEKSECCPPLFSTSSSSLLSFMLQIFIETLL